MSPPLNRYQAKLRSVDALDVAGWPSDERDEGADCEVLDAHDHRETVSRGSERCGGGKEEVFEAVRSPIRFILPSSASTIPFSFLLGFLLFVILLCHNVIIPLHGLWRFMRVSDGRKTG